MRSVDKLIFLKNESADVKNPFNMVWEDYQEPDYEEYVTCSWCGEDVPKSDCQHEVDMGWLCDYCIQAIESRGEQLLFDRGYDD